MKYLKNNQKIKKDLSYKLSKSELKNIKTNLYHIEKTNKKKNK